jgi:hypothetical protein
VEGTCKQGEAEGEAVMNRFIGTWKLISVEDREASGETSLPYGPDPAGLLIYDGGGRMAVQIMRRGRTSGNPDMEAGEALRSAVAGFTAFFGTYEINEAEGTVIHNVEGHLLPASVGKRLTRRYEFSGNRLTLSPSDTRRIIWERAD